MMRADPHYLALALQISCRAVNGLSSREASEEVMMRTIAHVGKAIAGAAGFHGDLALVVLPEYFLTGHPAGESIPQWRDLAAISMDGPQIEALGKIAANANVYLAGNAYEADPNFPSIYFQTSFILNSSGDLILKYRRLISMYTPSPYDVLDRYIDTYGEDALFPVIDTPLGKLAAIASEEILYPEIARCLSMKGAELFTHSSSEAALKGLSPKNLAKRARAMENMAYVVSANSSGIIGGPMLQHSTDACSQIVDYNGRVILEAENGESMNIVTEIDMASLRRARKRVGMSNYLARHPTKLFAQIYANSPSSQLPNGFMSEDGEVNVPERSFFRSRQQNAIERLEKLGVI
ncbi:nitrilase-related carbon-nitrogen hydrolase [Hirschia litorea]|uniref:Nitrilase-related carbon-nitrogen hydrolase n=1 Tax=Hirschia litorea TaxID=1199156 RepID=A0ABW2INN3_9PROT